MVNVKATKLGTTTRMNFAEIDEVMQMPNLIEIQKNSYQWFLDVGLKEVFRDIGEITDYPGNLVLEFVDYSMDEKPKYTVKECKANRATYSSSIHLTARLANKETGLIKESVVKMGEFPIMTESGTFIINGAERVIPETLTDERGSSLFMSEQTFTDKSNNTNRCYEVRIRLTIDDKTYTYSYPVMNGITPVKDNLMNQNAVHKAQMRAFVKCVAINTGLGFNLWMDDADIENDTDDLSKHNLFAIKERCQIAYTKAIKKGMSTSDIAKAVNKTEDEVRLLFTYFDALNRFEHELNAL